MSQIWLVKFERTGKIKPYATPSLWLIRELQAHESTWVDRQTFDEIKENLDEYDIRNKKLRLKKSKVQKAIERHEPTKKIEAWFHKYDSPIMFSIGFLSGVILTALW